ncbi:UDP-N-Acetylglucosamine 2-epimerase [Flavobacterium resistens]|uniref:UDP-N-acetylglucosamine 2-epimerase (non-hydrolyzing) n=1 Tax=Flavobacterium resistens TaxID=443612 RepID=A0A521ER24_9FLAO|nr:UDP-N-acetylglucosamine 2-epimerase (non-hydrolyzing) [Flavobacterium resistens]MRX67902.1 UDP-N-acetylglucosamine 2-epimerase (non-hydrolyzing) [Flavobacterium resistens]SMO86393.1 UDP-N-Acetylglucosamine 2-epimerase [Flavobacterium resistens]
MKILLCFGTRPEAIKMAPLYHKLKENNFEVIVSVTAQHREMLDQVLDFFDIKPDYDLDLMQPNQTLNNLSALILSKMDKVLLEVNPDLVFVHGDTTTSSMVALAAFHRGIKVAHVEAGLRTYNKHSPFPEEINRQLTGRLADIHFTPTNEATSNLVKEGISQSTIIQTGNTVIDALFWTISKIEKQNYIHPEIEELKNIIPSNKKIILVTGHRRENFGTGMNNLCEALLEVSKREDVVIVYPVHLNPNVKDVVNQLLSDKKNILLINPVSYPAFVWLMQKSFLIVSDSGGIQEEAPSLGKPVLVTRNTSERPEGVMEGFSKLVGTDKEKIINVIQELLENFNGFENKSNPYGNGNASKNIISFLQNLN